MLHGFQEHNVVMGLYALRCAHEGSRLRLSPPGLILSLTRSLRLPFCTRHPLPLGNHQFVLSLCGSVSAFCLSDSI